MFCVVCGHFLTPVDPRTSAWRRNFKILENASQALLVRLIVSMSCFKNASAGTLVSWTVSPQWACYFPAMLVTPVSRRQDGPQTQKKYNYTSTSISTITISPSPLSPLLGASLPPPKGHHKASTPFAAYLPVYSSTPFAASVLFSQHLGSV